MSTKDLRNLNYYERLELQRDFKPDELRTNWLNLSLLYHPDKGGDTVQFQLLLEAYECLKDPKAKKRYNQKLKRQAEQEAKKKAKEEQKAKEEEAKPKKPQEKRAPKSRWWFFTWNNPPALDNTALKAFFDTTKANYLFGQLEQGESGTPHFQFIAYYERKVRYTTFKEAYPTIHFEKCADVDESHDYCSKEEGRLDGPWTLGSKPFNPSSASDWERIYQLAKENRFEEIPAMLLVKHYNNLMKIAGAHARGTPTNHLRGIWIQGTSGQGKSCLARLLAGSTFDKATSTFSQADYYTKQANKWWDGYHNQRVVILDDLDDKHELLAHHMKLWGDQHDSIGEVKCGTIGLKHEWIIITSQYPIEQVFKDTPTQEAVRRRYHVFQIGDNIKPLNRDNTLNIELLEQIAQQFRERMLLKFPILTSFL